MKRLRLTLLSDGPSDRALIPILRWLLRQRSAAPFEQEWADLRRWAHRPLKLSQRVDAALDLFPCDLLVIHRDAEREPWENRVREIVEATLGRQLPIVGAVPVRMTEAWLLFDEAAIRRAAGCPNGTMDLRLPAAKSVEDIADPKGRLYEALKEASGLKGRRLERFRTNIHHLADQIDDFAPLRAVRSFRRFEESLCHALGALGVLRSDGAPDP